MIELLHGVSYHGRYNNPDDPDLHECTGLVETTDTPGYVRMQLDNMEMFREFVELHSVNWFFFPVEHVVIRLDGLVFDIEADDLNLAGSGTFIEGERA